MAVPDAVDDLAAEPDVQRLHFSWTEPANNGSAITKYTLYLDAVEHTDDVTSPHEVANLTGDVLSGPWTITATNGDGESDPSNEVSETPIEPTDPGSTTAKYGSGSGFN